MTRFLLLLIPVILLSACESKDYQSYVSEAVLENDSALIMENFRLQEECWNNGDIECYMQAYHPEKAIETISRAGVTDGYDAILGQYKKYFPKEKMGALHFDEFRIKPLNHQYYYVVGRFNLTYETPDTTYRGWFSVLMEKSGDKWYIISDHSS